MNGAQHSDKTRGRFLSWFSIPIPYYHNITLIFDDMSLTFFGFPTMLSADRHWAAWRVGIVCHRGKVPVAGASRHRQGWHYTWCAVHYRNAHISEGSNLKEQKLRLISGSGFLYFSSGTWIGHPRVQRNCFLNDSIGAVGGLCTIALKV